MKRWHTVEKKSDPLAENNLLLSFRHTYDKLLDTWCK